MALQETFGPPTFFLTLSSAEYAWEDVNKILRERNYDIEGVDKLPVMNLAANDPITLVDQLNRRFQAFWKHMILGKTRKFVYGCGRDKSSAWIS